MEEVFKVTKRKNFLVFDLVSLKLTGMPTEFSSAEPSLQSYKAYCKPRLAANFPKSRNLCLLMQAVDQKRSPMPTSNFLIEEECETKKRRTSLLGNFIDTSKSF